MVIVATAYVLGLAGLLVISKVITNFFIRIPRRQLPLKPIQRRAIGRAKPVFGECMLGLTSFD